MALQDYNKLYAMAGEQYGVDPELLKAQAFIESSGNPNAVGPETKWGTAKGIAQLIPDTAERLGVTDPFEPEQAIPGQARLMAENLKRYKTPEAALSAYHGGTDKANWGPKTKDYVGKVMKQYASATPQQFVDDVDDDASIFEAVRQDLAKSQPKRTSDDDDDAIFEEARRSLDEGELQERLDTKGKMSVGKDLALTALSAIPKGIGALPQIPGMGVNALTNAMGWSYGKLAGATPEQLQKLSNINPIFTGNTPLDAMNQTARALINDDPGQQNPLTGDVLHDPETMSGRFANSLIQSAIGGPATGIKMLPSLMGAAGGQAGAEAFPDNPLAPLVTGAVAGLTPAAIKAMRLRATPEEMAANVIKTQGSGLGDEVPVQPSRFRGAVNKLLAREPEQKFETPTPEGDFSFVGEKPIIPGIKNTLAEVAQDPELALVQRQIENKEPFSRQSKANENIRQEHFGKAAGTLEDIEALEDSRSNQSGPLYEVARKQPLDTKVVEPLISKIGTAIEEVGEGSEAGKTLISLREKINNSLPSTDEATGKTRNPTQSPLVQIFREERDNLAKPATAQGAYAGTVKSVIQPIVRELGDAIESQSPEFAKAQEIYRTYSPKIDAAKWLQGLNLTDAGKNFTLAKVKNALDNAKKAQSSPGYANKAKSLSPEQIQVLEDLHNDLRRREIPMRESMARGSNTKQNLLAEADKESAMGHANHLLGGKGAELVGSGLGMAAGSLVGHPTGGAFMGDLGVRGIKSSSARRMAKADAALGNFMLNPQAYKQFLLESQQNSFSNRLMKNLLTEQGEIRGPLRLTIRPSDK